MLARGAQAGGRGDAGHARVPVLGRDLLRHAHTEPVGATTCTSARASRACCAARRRSRGAQEAGADLEDAKSARSSASAPATWRRWPRSTAASSGRSTRATAPEIVAALQGGPRKPLPGRGLGDEGYKLPWRRRADGMRRPPLDGHRRAEPDARSTSTSASAATRRCARRSRDGPGRGPRASSRSPVCAAAAAPASRWARRRSFIPKGDDGQVPLLQRGRVRARHLQGPPADAEEPAPADRGHRSSPPTRPGANRAFIYIRGEYELQADILDAAVDEATRAATSARTSSARALAVAGRPPRRGRLHLRRGDRRCSTRSRASAATRA